MSALGPRIVLDLDEHALAGRVQGTVHTEDGRDEPLVVRLRWEARTLDGREAIAGPRAVTEVSSPGVHRFAIQLPSHPPTLDGSRLAAAWFLELEDLDGEPLRAPRKIEVVRPIDAAQLPGVGPDALRSTLGEAAEALLTHRDYAQTQARLEAKRRRRGGFGLHALGSLGVAAAALASAELVSAGASWATVTATVVTAGWALVYLPRFGFPALRREVCRARMKTTPRWLAPGSPLHVQVGFWQRPRGTRWRLERVEQYRSGTRWKIRREVVDEGALGEDGVVRTRIPEGAPGSFWFDEHRHRWQLALRGGGVVTREDLFVLPVE